MFGGLGGEIFVKLFWVRERLETGRGQGLGFRVPKLSQVSGY
jgi:hypothetical protein